MLFCVDRTRPNSSYLWDRGREVASDAALDVLTGELDGIRSSGDWVYVLSGGSLWAVPASMTGTVRLLAGPLDARELWPAVDGVCVETNDQHAMVMCANQDRTVMIAPIPEDLQIVGAVDHMFVAIDIDGPWGYLGEDGFIPNGFGAVVGVGDQTVFWIDPAEPHLLRAARGQTLRTYQHDDVAGYRIAFGEVRNGTWVGTYSGWGPNEGGVLKAGPDGLTLYPGADAATQPFFLDDTHVAVLMADDEDTAAIYDCDSGESWPIATAEGAHCVVGDCDTMALQLAVEEHHRPDDAAGPVIARSFRLELGSGARLRPVYRSSELPVGASKIGGLPDLSQPWPVGPDGRRMGFIMQLNVDDAAMFGAPGRAELGLEHGGGTPALLSVFGDVEEYGWGYDSGDSAAGAVILNAGPLRPAQGPGGPSWALAYHSFQSVPSPPVAKARRQWGWTETHQYAEVLSEMLCDDAGPGCYVDFGGDPGHWAQADEAIAAVAMAQGGLSGASVGQAMLRIRHPLLRAMFTRGKDLRVMLAAHLPAGVLGRGARTLHLVGREGSDVTSWRLVAGRG